MATKMLKNGDIRQLDFVLTTRWDYFKGQVSLSGKSTYNLIALKKTIHQLADPITEAFLTVGQQHGGSIDDQGRLKIPDDQVPEVNKELTDIALQEQEVTFTPILVRD